MLDSGTWLVVRSGQTRYIGKLVYRTMPYSGAAIEQDLSYQKRSSAQVWDILARASNGWLELNPCFELFVSLAPSRSATGGTQFSRSAMCLPPDLNFDQARSVYVKPDSFYVVHECAERDQHSIERLLADADASLKAARLANLSG